MKIVVFDNKTFEVLAAVYTDGISITRNDISFQTYGDDVEPVFTEVDNKIILNANAVIYERL